MKTGHKRKINKLNYVLYPYVLNTGNLYQTARSMYDSGKIQSKLTYLILDNTLNVSVIHGITQKVITERLEDRLSSIKNFAYICLYDVLEAYFSKKEAMYVLSNWYSDRNCKVYEKLLVEEINKCMYTKEVEDIIKGVESKVLNALI